MFAFLFVIFGRADISASFMRIPWLWVFGSVVLMFCGCVTYQKYYILNKIKIVDSNTIGGFCAHNNLTLSTKSIPRIIRT
jgi:hypothetical protein